MRRIEPFKPFAPTLMHHYADSACVCVCVCARALSYNDYVDITSRVDIHVFQSPKLWGGSSRSNKMDDIIRF